MIGKRHDPNIFVTVRESIPGGDLEVYVYRRGVSGVEMLAPNANETIRTGRIAYGWTEPRSAWEPTRPSDVFMRLGDFAPQLLAALAEMGVPSPDRSFTEGKLVAMEAHLKDMRQLVFEPEGYKG